MSRNFQDCFAALQQLRELFLEGNDWFGTLSIRDYYEDRLAEYIEQIANIYRVTGQMRWRIYQISAVLDFQFCYGTAAQQGVDGEAFLMLAKSCKKNLQDLIEELETDIKIAETWDFYDRRVIKWVDRWEDVCEYLKDYFEGLYNTYFEE